MANENVNIRGINIAGIGEIKQAISEYKDAVNQTKGLGLTEYQINKNLKGNQAKTQIIQLSDALKAKVGNLIKLLDSLTESLNEVQKNYENQDNSLGTSISGVVSNIKS